MIVFTSIVLFAGVLAMVLLVRPSDIPPPQAESPAQHLDERKAAIYENLKDLNFEFRLGKLSEEDYQKTKLGLQKELAEVLAETDRVLGRVKPAPAAAPAASSSESAAPAASTVKAAKSVTVPAVDPFTCPSCGARFETALKFCGECGKPMPGVKA
jgi:hypothetical protein